MPLRSLIAAALAVPALTASTATAPPASAAAPHTVQSTTASPRAPHRGVVGGARAFRPDARSARAVDTFRSLRKRRQQTHEFWGVEPTASSHDGMQATQSVDPSYRVSYSQDFTYTPTLKAAGSCMEITTAYWQGGGDELWAWDWCGGDGPAKEVSIDTNFLATYTSTATGHPAYSVQVVKTGTNAWSSYLYNYTTNSWNLFFSKSGRDTSGLAYGWDIFEIYSTVDPATGTGYYCTDAKNTVFESSGIQLRHNGSWHAASPADSPWEPTTDPDPADYQCPSLKFIRAGANDHWIVRH